MMIFQKLKKLFLFKMKKNEGSQIHLYHMKKLGGCCLLQQVLERLNPQNHLQMDYAFPWFCVSMPTF
jgi:hypothetical protein